MMRMIKRKEDNDVNERNNEPHDETEPNVGRNESENDQIKSSLSHVGYIGRMRE